MIRTFNVVLTQAEIFQDNDDKSFSEYTVNWFVGTSNEQLFTIYLFVLSIEIHHE
jgi:hypothetical protein